MLLTGKGGDEWFTGSPLVLADAVRSRRPRRIWRTLRQERDVWVARGSLHLLLRSGVRPLLPARVQAVAQRERLPAWLPKRFWGPVGLEERIRPPRLGGESLARAAVARWLDDGGLQLTTESSERTLARAGLEARSPFDDRRVVELALALPEDLRRRGHASKWVVRSAMAGRVPDEVRLRGDKANMIAVFHGELAAQGGRALFGDLALADLGWVESKIIEKHWDALEAGHDAGTGIPHAWALWTILSTERWVRAMF